MGYRQIILLFASLFTVAIYLNLPGNRVWLNERILNFSVNIQEELDNMSLDARREYRLGMPYNGSLSIKEQIAEWDIKDPLVLLPSHNYLKVHGVDVIMPEPIVFYYYTGLRSVQPSSKNVLQANVALYIDNDVMGVIRLKDSEDVKYVLKDYQSPGL